MKKVGLLLWLFLFLAKIVCGQSLITFDDISAVDFGSTSPNSIVNGYSGFNWVNFYVLNTTSFPQSGFVNGTLSGSNVAVSSQYEVGDPPVKSTISASVPFMILSGYFTSAHQAGMSLEIIGLNGNVTVFDQTYTVNITGPSFLTFPSSPVTEVDFEPSGGSLPGPAYFPGGPQMVLDNLTIAPVPEPSSLYLFAGGFGTVIWLNRRRSHC